jgi:cytochrome b
MAEMRSIPVWDAGTRWFHWINASCVMLLMVVGFVILNADALEVSNAGKVILKSVHVWIGYVLIVNLMWRFVWAFIGNRHAHWRAILPVGSGYFRELRDYCRAFVSRSPQPHLGHNPAGRLGVAVLMLLLLVQALTGLFLAGSDLFFPPFGQWMAQWIAAPGVDPGALRPYAPETYDPEAYASLRAIRKSIVTLHLYNFYALVATVALHLAAVIVTELREGTGLVSAMITGKKTMPSMQFED